MILFLNPNCDHDTGLSKWKKIEKEVQTRLGAFELVRVKSIQQLNDKVKEALHQGERNFIAAGGDGTIHLLLNALIQCHSKPNTILGAIGLGSSNDYHKPYNAKSLIQGIPVKLDFTRTILRDVIQIVYSDTRGKKIVRFCLINASIGITAEGNAVFSSRRKWIRMLQRVSIDAAIMASALKTIFSYSNLPAQMMVNNREEMDVSISNLGVIKNPHFTGSLCYDTPIEPDDGLIGINLSYNLSIYERIRLLLALQKRRFQGRPKARCWKATKLRVKSNRMFALEMDGEVIYTNKAEFHVLPKRLRCCS